MAQLGISANKLELLQIADSVAREKVIDRAIVIEAMEEAIQKAARAKYGSENDITARIDVKTGEIHLTRRREVVEEVTDMATQMILKDAQAYNKELNIGDFFEEELPPLEYGRVSAQNAKQVILQKVREAERDRQYEEFKDKVGEIVNGTVKRVEHGHVIVDLGGRAEAIIRRNETLPRESMRYDDRVRAYVHDVRREQRGPQIFLSRTRPEFMAKLFSMEVPEIYEGVVELKSVARDPGSRAKIAVFTNDSTVDPVGACVGLRGARVQAVVNELHGEKIDIVLWSENAATFIVNALAPAEVSKVVLDEDSERIEVVVPNEQLSLAIGRRGQNVRLATQLTGWNIDIMTEADESERRQAEFVEHTALFVEQLNVDEMIAQLLTTDGFTTIEEVAYVDISELQAIEGFEEDTAEELQARAREHIDNQNEKLDEKRIELGVDDQLAALPGLTPAMLVALGENDVKTVEDMAGCVTDDFLGWTERKNGERKHYDGYLEGFGVSREELEIVIMTARLEAGWITEEDILREEAGLMEMELEAGDTEEILSEVAEETPPDEESVSEEENPDLENKSL